MSAVADFERLIDQSTATRIRGPWLVSMLLGQGHELQRVAERLDKPGLEHMSRAIAHAARLHETVAREVPVIRRGKIVGSPNPKLLVGWALTTGLLRTRPDVDGILATGLRSIAASRVLIQLIHEQVKFGADLTMAVDQAAALSSALERAEAEVRQFGSSASGPQPE